MSIEAHDKDVARFGRWADEYDRSFLQRRIFAPVHEFALQQAASLEPAPASILDVGCGTGQLLRRAAHRFPGAELTGVDAAEDMIRVAKSSVPEGVPVRFVHAFAEELPFPDASFDLVVTTWSFHHWTDQRRGLREVHRVLSPGGVFALADALPVGLVGRVMAATDHGAFNKPAALEEMLRGAGLDVERLIPVPRFSRAVWVALARLPLAEGRERGRE